MAQIQISEGSARRHGFPYACMVCGSDEEIKVNSYTLRCWPLWSKLLILLLLLVGPIGWVLAAVVIGKGFKETRLPVPSCQACDQGLKHLTVRDQLLCAAGVILLLRALMSPAAGGYWIGLGLLCWGLGEYLWISRQFRIRPLRIKNEQITLEVPYEDYPGIYQRHLDTALLYGSSSNLGVNG